MNMHHKILFSQNPILGYFRYKDVFQIIKGEDDWEVPKYNLLFQKPLVLEYNSDYFKSYPIVNQKNEQILKANEPFKHFDFLKELVSLISLITNDYFYADRHYLHDLALTSINTFTDCKSEKGLLYSNKSFYTPVGLGDNIELPISGNIFLDKYFSLNTDILFKIRMSLVLYYNSISISKHSPSMSYVALVSSLENLMEMEAKINGFKPKKCECCNQMEYKSTSRFRDLIEKYGDVPIKKKEINKFLNKLYSRRSKIAHGGKLFYHDYANYEYDYNGVKELDKMRMVTRTVIFNWVLQNK